MISQTVLVVAGPFGDALSAEDVTQAIGRGLVAGGLPEPDLCPLDGDSSIGGDSFDKHRDDVRVHLDTLDFDASGNLTAHNGQHSAQSFAFNDSLGGCYRSDVGTLSGVGGL